MKLRALSQTNLLVTSVGLLLLLAFSLNAWRTIEDNLSVFNNLSQLRIEVEQFNNAIDYATLLHSDRTVLHGIDTHAGEIIEAFRVIDHPSVATAVVHLRELAHLSRVMAGLVPYTPLLHGGARQHDPLSALLMQMLIHRAGINDALDTIKTEKYRQSIAMVIHLVGTLVFGALGLALFGIGGFAYFHRRLSKPLAAIEDGLRAVARGDLAARIRIAGKDELADMAGLFNHMAEQRQNFEATLAEQEQRFRQLAENIDEVFWMTSLDKHSMLYISPAFERIWGTRCAALYQDPSAWLESIHDEDRARVRAAALNQATGNYREEYRIVRPDGSVRHILDRAFPIRDEHGEVYRIAGVALDITERRQMEFDLKERGKELRTLYRVLELTSEHNRPVEQICKDVADLLPEGFMFPSHAVARIVIGETEYASIGWTKPVASLRSDISDQDTIGGFVEVGYTQHPAGVPPEHSPFLPQERDLMEGVARHIWRMLHMREMMLTMQQNERLSAVGQLTGGIAHDFNNLLTVIIGNTEVLQSRLGDDGQLRMLIGMIDTAAQRGAELTRRLLAFSRHQALEPRIVDINALLEGMTDLLERTLGEHIEIKFVQDPNVWTALVDPGQLENALLNLCLNARDAMNNGGHLTIETSNTALDEHYAQTHLEVLPGDYVLLSVSDTGEGIPAKLLDKVFEPFFTTKEAGKGTGMGLAMVHGFIKQSQGHISIYSELGQGTTVRLYLPRAHEGATGAHKGGAQTQALRGVEKILLVEDDRLVRRYAHEQLEALGYTVLTATNAREALDLLNGNPDVDLLFTDVVMPGGMNGRELAEAACSRYPRLKVLYTSGYTRNAIVHNGRLDPGVLLLPKPYRQVELACKIREALDTD